MKILVRYLIVHLIKSTLLILSVFISLEIFILLASQLNHIGRGSYTLWQALYYVLLVLPQQTYFLFPMAGLLGMIFGFSRLAGQSELIIMRSAGLSPLQIAVYALQAGAALIIVMTLLGEAVGPLTKSLAEKHKFILINTGKALKTDGDLWLREGENIYDVKTVYSEKHIADISRYTFSQGKLISASYAKEGRYIHHAWQMTDIKESRIMPDKIVSLALPEAVWRLAVDPYLLKIAQQSSEEISLSRLLDLLNYQKANHLAGAADNIAFWQRIFQPFASLVMMFLAVPFVFGPLRSAGMSLRLIAGGLTGFGFYLINELFPSLSAVLDFPPIVAAVLPTAIFLAASIILMKKIK